MRRRSKVVALVAVALLSVPAVSSAAEAPGFQLLGKLSPDHDSWPLGVSGDGSVVSGLSGTGTRYDAFRWTSAGGMQSIGAPAGFTDGSADRAVGHASSGPWLQQNLVCVLEGE